MQYENNLRKICFTEREKKNIWFTKKPFSKRYIWKKGGRLIIRVFLYSGQYGSFKTVAAWIWFWEENRRNLFCIFNTGVASHKMAFTDLKSDFLKTSL